MALSVLRLARLGNKNRRLVGWGEMSDGRSFVVTLDLDAGVAVVEPHDGSTYTVARSDTSTRLLAVDAEELRERVDGAREGERHGAHRHRGHDGPAKPVDVRGLSPRRRPVGDHADGA